MATVAEILTHAAKRCSVKEPNGWAAATAASAVELRDDIMFQVVEDILDRVDPPRPISKSATLTGDGTSETFTLPTDFRRLQRGRFAIFQTGYPTKQFVPVHDDGEYDAIKDQGLAGATFYYRINALQGAQSIDIYNPPASGTTINLNYVSNRWIRDASSDDDEFQDDADISYLPKQLLSAGITYRFRERKGLDYGDVQQDFELQLARFANRNNTTRRIGPSQRDVRWVFDIPVPDFIPPGSP